MPPVSFSATARGFLVLGPVFLAVTGAEALYADMGRFGQVYVPQVNRLLMP